MPDETTQTQEQTQPIKRKRGRPLGSKNKAKVIQEAKAEEEISGTS